MREAFDDLDAKGVLGPIEKAKRAALTKAAAALDRSLNGGAPSVATSNVLKTSWNRSIVCLAPPRAPTAN